MATSFAASRAQLIYAICLPLAVLMGYFLASPTDISSVAIFVTLCGVLILPVLMNCYHAMLVACWNAALTPYFLPGAPHMWMVLSLVGFGFAIINRFINPEAKFVAATSLNRSMMALLIVVGVTAIVRGGIGMRIMGSASYGGKNYFAVAAAILGYFALISQRVPISRAAVYVAIFFLSSLTALVPNLALMGGPKLYFLYLLFPAFLAQEQAIALYGTGAEFTRLTGLTFASMGFYCWLLSKYGLRGIFEWSKPWRIGLFCLAFAACLFTGYRSFLLLFLMTICFQFIAEGLFRPRILLPVGAAAVIVAGIALPNASQLPAVVQRSLSFLPVEISPAIRQSASGSSEWRLKMWKDIGTQIPDYLVLGKGYSINPDELRFAPENTRRGFSPEYGGAMTAGDYHSGPLSVIIPFGIWGVLAVGTMFVTGWRFLYYHYKNGPAHLTKINRFLLVFFTVRILYFLTVFGSLSYDLFSFTGMLGLSAAINGASVLKREQPPEQVFSQATPERKLVGVKQAHEQKKENQ